MKALNARHLFVIVGFVKMRAWFSGRMTAFQAVDESSILSTRTQKLFKVNKYKNHSAGDRAE